VLLQSDEEGLLSSIPESLILQHENPESPILRHEKLQEEPDSSPESSIGKHENLKESEPLSGDEE